jgi:cyclase
VAPLVSNTHMKTAFAIALTLTLLAPSVGFASDSTLVFRTQRLAEGVFVISATEPPGLGGDPNTVVVVGRTGTLIVDAQFSASATAAVMHEVRKVATSPVRWLVNTHWHDDHVSGNAAWRRAYPSVEILGHRYMLEDMPQSGAANRASMLKSVPGTSAFLRDLEAKGMGIDGQPTDAVELRAYAAYRTLIGRFAAESLLTHAVLPTRMVDDSLALDLGGRTVVLRYFGPAHTRGDLVVQVPDAGLLAVGDIVSWPVPLIGTTSFPREYGRTLDRLLAVPHRMLVPGHGPVLTSDEYPRQMSRMLARIRVAVDSMRLAGDSLAKVQRTVRLDEFRQLFARNDRLLNTLFSNYVVQSAIPKAYADGVRNGASGVNR